ncbi:MAG TPA: hypothetical protein VK611_12510 [Acidimicrobiales bacterium]|nr:hypothetical protein [Acidimicrobiales bacterium]
MWRAVTAAAGFILLSACSSTADEEPTADDIKYGAFDVCTQFVKDRLLSPGSAEFPNEFEDDGEVIITSVADEYTVVSHVDSENGFGALLQTPFSCKVRHVEGTRYRLVDLQLDER